MRSLLRGGGLATLSADGAASALHLSTRTLHRQLSAQGASFQALKDDVRRERAVDQLHRTTRPIKQIALAIGFRSEKSFARAFKVWTGDSPDELRRKAPSVLVRTGKDRGS